MKASPDPQASGLEGRSAALATPFTARLRAATKGEHEAIERNRRLSRLMQTDLDIAEYVSILARLADFFGPVESELRRWAARFPAIVELDARLVKRELLVRDIAALAPDLPPARPAPDASQFQPLATIERAWGCLYVFEGATLGGQIMARSLHQQFGFTAEHGTAFYNAYGRQNGARWQTFKAALNAGVVDDGLEEGEIIASAQATFQSMNAWMDAEP